MTVTAVHLFKNREQSVPIYCPMKVNNGVIFRKIDTEGQSWFRRNDALICLWHRPASQNQPMLKRKSRIEMRLGYWFDGPGELAFN